MNQATEQQRLNVIRELLKEKQTEGKLGVIAARADVPEWVLREWCENPIRTPSRNEVVDIQTALSEKVTLTGGF